MFDREPGEAAVSVHVAEEKRDATVTKIVKYSLEIYAISFPASFGAKLQSSMVPVLCEVFNSALHSTI